MDKLKKKFQNLNPSYKKTISAIIVAILFVSALLVTVYAYVGGRSVGFIFFYCISVIAIFEITSFLDLKKIWRIYVCLILSLFLFFFPLENGIIDVIDKGWETPLENPNVFTLNNEVVHSRSILKPIKAALIFNLIHVDGLGYLFYAILSFIPTLFNNWGEKINFRKQGKMFIIIFIFIFIIVLATKFIFYWTVFKFTILAIFMSGIIAADTFAYFGGMFLSRFKYLDKKLAPNISPNKTVIGAICGFIFSFLIVFLSFYFTNIIGETFEKTKDIELNLALSLSLAFVIPIFAILGDLSFSWAKRKFKTKDFSTLIPEHGGVLDRFDSTIFVSIIFSVIILAVFI